MKKLFILPCILFSLFVTTAAAQGANTPKNTLAANKNHPALSSGPVKPMMAKKEPRSIKMNSNGMPPVKPAKK